MNINKYLVISSGERMSITERCQLIDRWDDKKMKMKKDILYVYVGHSLEVPGCVGDYKASYHVYEGSVQVVSIVPVHQDNNTIEVYKIGLKVVRTPCVISCFEYDQLGAGRIRIFKDFVAYWE